MNEGWHPDPMGRHEVRFHDGREWTDHVSTAGVAATDPLPPEAQRPLGCRDSCPTCGERDLQVVQVGSFEASTVYQPTTVLGMSAQASIREARTASLLCLGCGALHGFLPPESLAAARAALGWTAG